MSQESDAAERYARALLTARQHGFALTRASEALLVGAFRDAIRRLTQEIRVSNNPLTAERAVGIRRELIALLAALERDVGRITQASVDRTVADIVAIHQRVTLGIAAGAGLAGSRVAGVAARFDQAAVRAAAIVASRRPAASFATLYRRHLLEAAPALDRLLTAAVVQGMSSRRLARDIATLLGGGTDLSATALGVGDLDGLRSLRFDARRIAVSETNTALREASAQALDASGLVEAVQWTRSGRHDAIPHLAPDECDVLAEVDFYGLGPGWYAPALFPVAPHPFCACSPGATRMRHPSEWLTPPPAASAALQLSPLSMRLPPAWATRWTPAREQRARLNVAASLAREARPTERRRAA